MKNCKKCNNPIPKHIEIEGIRKKVSCKRLHCYKCAPFVSNKGANGFCMYCDKRVLKHCTICVSCQVNRKRSIRKQRCVDYKGGKCEKCEYDKCLDALAFHHRDPSQKDFAVGRRHCTKWENVQKELNKCDLLCHNCHSEVHKEEREKQKALIQEKIKKRKLQEKGIENLINKCPTYSLRQYDSFI